MKLNKILTCILAMAGVAGLSHAQTVVDITGATAFRAAMLNTIKARFDAGTGYRYGYTGSSFTGTNHAIFEGNFPGVSGTTVVRTSSNGSVEGIRALVESPAQDPVYLDTSVLTGPFSATPTAQSGLAIPTVKYQSEIAFSDVSKAATPYAALPLEPASAAVGVVVFTMLKGEGGHAALTNVTQKQFEAVFKSGFQPLSLFTGDSSHSGDLVFAMGRNDGSGTRTTYMAETGTGITTLVQQYIATTAGGEVQRIQLAGTTGSNISTVWGQNVDGNGGHSSGSFLRDVFGFPSTAVDVFTDPSTDADGADNSYTSGGVVGATGDDAEPDLDEEGVTLITFLTVSDALAAITAGATALAYNGVSITPANPLSAADQDKVKYGAYTAWSNQQMYRRPGLTADQLTVEAGIRSNIATNIGASGIPSSQMQVNRAVDGGVIFAN